MRGIASGFEATKPHNGPKTSFLRATGFSPTFCRAFPAACALSAGAFGRQSLRAPRCQPGVCPSLSLLRALKFVCGGLLSCFSAGLGFAAVLLWSRACIFCLPGLPCCSHFHFSTSVRIQVFTRYTVVTVVAYTTHGASVSHQIVLFARTYTMTMTGHYVVAPDEPQMAF